MTDSQALRIICEAALLEDSEAAALLRQHYSALPYDHDCKGEFLLALAWLNPEEARALMPELGFWAHTVETRIVHLCEAQALNQGEADGVLAYRTMTALLPLKPLKQDSRFQVQRYALALRSPEEYIAYVELYREQRDPFLIARLWHRHTEAFWKRGVSDGSNKVRAIGRFVLAQRAKPEDLPARLTLYWERQKEYLEDMDEEQEYEGLLQTMAAFEAATPAQIEALAPQALAALIPLPEQATVALAARILRAAAKAGVSSTAVRQFLIEREGEKALPLSHRWAAQVRKAISSEEPVLPVALEFVRILRGFALIQLLGNYLYEEPAQKKVNRAWRWLLRSTRLINSIEDPFWREHLQQKRHALETQIRQSQRRRHTVARKGT